MAKTMQVLHLVDHGNEYLVIRHFGKTNPYRIYHCYRDIGADGFPHDHKRLMEQYGNLASCFYWFIDHRIGWED